LGKPANADRVPGADGQLENGGTAWGARKTYDWTDVPGGFHIHHLSAHLRGGIPYGGNLLFLDGHVQWRRFDDMLCRTYNYGGPNFWW
jgi:prepilin-type processing-associated H-X9-DG protein